MCYLWWNHDKLPESVQYTDPLGVPVDVIDVWQSPRSQEMAMLRRVFYSFHYAPDCWRLQQIINMGGIEGQKIVHSNEWETIERNPECGIRRKADGESEASRTSVR